MKEKAKGYISWVITIAVAAVVVGVVYGYEISSYGFTKAGAVRFLGDGFFVAAVLYLGIGALVWISNLGGMNGLHYLLYQVVTLFTPRNQRFQERKSYFDFLKERDKKGKSDNKALLITGGICLILSVILAFVFDRTFC